MAERVEAAEVAAAVLPEVEQLLTQVAFMWAECWVPQMFWEQRRPWSCPRPQHHCKDNRSPAAFVGVAVVPVHGKLEKKNKLIALWSYRTTELWTVFVFCLQ